MGLTNSQYDAIMRQYSEYQLENKRILAQKREEIAKAIPEILAIEEQIAELSMDYAIGALENNNVLNIRNLQQAIQTLSKKKAELLVAHNYPEDFLKETYHCNQCHDTGFTDGARCQCFNKAVVNLFYSQSNNKNINKFETFDSFDISKYSRTCVDPVSGKNSYEHMQDVYNTVFRFTRNFGKSDWNDPNAINNLLFYGDTGLGKTFLSNCVANELIHSCHSVIYLTAIELFNTYSRSEFNKEADQSEIAQEITNCDLLIIDDLGTELANSFTNSRLFYCINERLLKNKSTIISTNLSLDKLYEQYSDRIFSRIVHSYKTLKFFGDNIRLASLKPAK